MEKATIYQRRWARITFLGVLCLATIVSVVKLSRASIGNITKSDLSGSWQMTLIGNTGCGLSSYVVTFTLNSSGVATNATETGHFTTGSPCADGSVTSGQSFTINSLTSNGSGSAGLTCGAGCGWTFDIQVAPDRSVFNVVDVSTANPNNLLEGTAIHQ
jgi:hypothetical protein